MVSLKPFLLVLTQKKNNKESPVAANEISMTDNLTNKLYFSSREIGLKKEDITEKLLCT